MNFKRGKLDNDQLIHFYRSLLLPRMIEDKMLVLLRQGKIGKWFSGIGQEAISVGATLAMEKNEWILPLHRNLGVFTTRNMPLANLFHQWQGNASGYSKARERSFHFGSKAHYICGMISHLGPQLAIADGIALAYQQRGQLKATLAFTGEGGTSEGDFHEALNMAAVWGLPVIFLIENNGYGLSTPTNEQYHCEYLVDRAKGYGMEGERIDGNNILEVYQTIQRAREYCINMQRPYLIECTTFRMRGHEEASGVKYVPKNLMEQWSRKDPIKNYEQFLVQEKVLTEMQVATIRNEIKDHIDAVLNEAMQPQAFQISIDQELADVFYSDEGVAITPYEKLNNPILNSKRFIEAISEALKQAMVLYPELILMGQDIAEYGGAFKVTEGFVTQFGKQRVRNTPICESAIVGAALGLSLEGIKSVVEMQFADFVSVGFNQIVNNLAKINYRWGQNADVVIRMPTGAGVGAGPFHSQSNEAWFTHVPGLKVVYPSNPVDAKGLLMAAIADPNPILFFEHKALYRSISADVPDEYYQIPMGKAKLVHEGEDACIITYGMGVIWAQQYQQNHPELAISILDLRSLAPLDDDAISEVVRATGKVCILHEDNLTGGIGGEISAWISEHCFPYLDAPIMRCASLDTPIPFNLELEKQYLANSRLEATMQKLLEY
ncbi:MAG: dehydrogenase E1 component subunit alpha/beta [Sediminibacterium sp.]|jgi:2-oxoisovalerate dehydrogenase E1 component|nr:dehydrogenase E1 component subunit alpha/beta [Sediminibacterium sp.]